MAFFDERHSSESMDRMDVLSSTRAFAAAGGSSVVGAARGVQHRMLGPVAWTAMMARAKRCEQCEKSLKKGKKVRCRRCGGIHCRACTSNKIPLRMYLTPFGRRRNKKNTNQVVCDKCYLEDAFEQERNEQEERVQGYTKQARAKRGTRLLGRKNKKGKRQGGQQAETNPAQGQPSSTSAGGDGEEQGRDRSESSSSRLRHVRARTLDRYTSAMIEASQNDSSTLDEGYRLREAEAQQKRNAAAEARSKGHKANHSRARSLRENFFADVLNTDESEAHKFLDPQAAPTKVTEGEAGVAPLQGITIPERRWFSPLLFSPSSGNKRSNEEEDGALMADDFEEALQANVEKLQESVKLAKEGEKKLKYAQLESVKLLRANLLKAQDQHIASAKNDSKAVVAELKAHVATLKKALDAKLNGTGDEPAAVRKRRQTLRKMTQAKGAGGDVTLAEELLRFQAEVQGLREQLVMTIKHLDTLLLEKYFPRCMQWKLRVDAGEGLYVGIRDIEVEMLSANFEVRVGPKPGHVLLRVSDIKAIVGIYQFAIKGKSTTARLLGGILTPTINRLDAEISGDWVLALRFEPEGDKNSHEPRWVQDKEESKFSLRISKKTSGASMIRLPDRVIKWLATSLLPSVISQSIIQSLPPSIGTFSLTKHNSIQIDGELKILGDVSPTVWRVPLVGATKHAETARRALGVSVQEAVILDHLLRGPLATAAGFHKKATSLNRLYKWRLQYASHKLDSLRPLFALIQKDSAVRNVPEDWFAQLIQRVCDLAVKPVSFLVKLMKVDIDLDIRDALGMSTSLYLDAFENQIAISVTDSSSGKAKAAASNAVREARRAADAVTHYYDSAIVPMVGDKFEVKLNAMLAGGEDGILAVSLSDLIAGIRLPASGSFDWLLGAAWVLSDGVVLRVSGEEGPRDGEYTVSLVQTPSSGEILPTTSTDGDLTLRNANLALFPGGSPSGTVRLTADDLRASILLSTMAQMIMFDWSEGMPERERLAEEAKARAIERQMHLSSEDMETANLIKKSRGIVNRLIGSYYDTFERGGRQGLTSAADLVGAAPELLARKRPTSKRVLDSSAARRDAEEQHRRKSSVTAAASASLMAGNQQRRSMARATSVGSVTEFEAGLGRSVVGGDASSVVEPVVGSVENTSALLPFLLNDDYRLYLDLRAMALSLNKHQDAQGRDTIRAKLTRQDVYNGSHCATFHIRRNLNEVFDDWNPMLD